MAAISTGLPARASGSSTSKKILNRPEYEALKIGVTAMSPSDSTTSLDGSTETLIGKAGDEHVGQFMGMIPQVEHIDLCLDVELGKGLFGGHGEAIGKEPGR